MAPVESREEKTKGKLGYGLIYLLLGAGLSILGRNGRNILYYLKKK